jgi:hypothetical protein
MNRHEQKRRRLAREQAARAQQPAPAVVAAEPPRGEMRDPWPKGTSGNPGGSSQKQRDRTSLFGQINAQNVDGSIGRRIATALSPETIARIVLARCLAGDWRFFKLMLKWTEEPYEPEMDGPPSDRPIPDLTVDPAVIARMMAAAEALDLTELDEDPARGAAAPLPPPPPNRTEERTPAPAIARALGHEKPPDMSYADWNRLRRGR